MKIIDAMPYKECESCKRCILDVYKQDGKLYVDCKRKMKCAKEDEQRSKGDADGK